MIRVPEAVREQIAREEAEDRRPRAVVRVQVTLYPEDLEAFDALCKAEGVSRSVGLRGLIRARLDGWPRGGEGVSRRVE